MIPLNSQPVEKQVLTSDGKLDVVSVWPTIQGEGPFAGTPAVFVRLAGCNLDCPKCDTDYTTRREPLSVGELTDRINSSQKWRGRAGQGPLAVLTGGEPFRQNIAPLIHNLVRCGYRVQVETNGTLFIPSLPHHLFTTVCSPKTPVIDERIKKWVTALKYVVEAGKVDWLNDGLPLSTLGRSCAVARPWRTFEGEVFVQPLDTGDPTLNEANLNTAVKSCMMFGYRLCLQIHKALGLE
jgi:7-carboxy-7-deazaguanine synthase